MLNKLITCDREQHLETDKEFKSTIVNLYGEFLCRERIKSISRRCRTVKSNSRENRKSVMIDLFHILADFILKAVVYLVFSQIISDNSMNWYWYYMKKVYKNIYVSHTE